MQDRISMIGGKKRWRERRSCHVMSCQAIVVMLSIYKYEKVLVVDSLLVKH